MSWQDQMKIDVDAILANDWGAIDITHYHEGAAGVVVRAHVFTDALEGSNQEDGDGPVLDSMHGQRERMTGHLEISKDIDVSPEDLWDFLGYKWTTIRKSGMDNGAQGIRVVHNIGAHTRLPRLRVTRQFGSY